LEEERVTEMKPAALKNFNTTIARLLALAIALSVLLFAACGGGSENTNTTPSTSKSVPAGNIAVLETDAGNIKIELLPNDSPKTVENFKLLAQSNFYNGLVFHRIQSGFMIQGGDPNGNGTGGRTASGQPLPNEINTSSPLYQAGYLRGVVAMANRGRPETGSSQFFIMHQNYRLPPAYTIFGKVTEGIEIVDKIATAPLSAPERPATPVVMRKVYIQ
jgi:cyclophilin family peptidyl-prolyl cis-trans isomerase